LSTGGWASCTEESQALDAWENELQDRIVTLDVKAIFVGRVTWNGQRELLYYVDKSEPVTEALEQTGDHGTARPFSFETKFDENWDEVGVYLNSTN
jgi:hypothetical protein